MTTPRNNVISLLGVQGLSRNNYSVVQLKVVLALISHAQKVINDYVVDGEMPNRSMRKYLTPSQLTYGYSAVVIRLSELCASTNHYGQVKNALEDMTKHKPIAIPFKCEVNQVTYYAEFPRLFSCEFTKMGGKLAVEFRFSNALLYFPMAGDKITARRHLMSWIKRCPPLWEGIRQLGYHQRCQYFSPKMVQLIYHFLGEPG